MNTGLGAWGNAKQTHLQLNIHLTFGLEFEVSINFHVPLIRCWDTCPDVSPSGCKCFVIPVLCYSLWRDWGQPRETCPVKCRKVWTSCPPRHQSEFPLYSCLLFSIHQGNANASRNQTLINKFRMKTNWQAPSLPSKPIQFPQENLLCLFFFFWGYLHDYIQYTYKMDFFNFPIYQF